MNLIDKWMILLECPHCKQHIELYPVRKKKVKVIIKAIEKAAKEGKVELTKVKEHRSGMGVTKK